MDIATFRPLAASHPCVWQIRGTTLEVLFQPIALPDSNVNEAASHGFFVFSLEQKPDLPDGTFLYNPNVEIVFDFNPPIFTNTVLHIVGQLTVEAFEPFPGPPKWEIWGNPAHESVVFRSTETSPGEKQFLLFDLAGRLVRSITFFEEVFDFQCAELHAGGYFFKIADAAGRGLAAGKFIKNY